MVYAAGIIVNEILRKTLSLSTKT